MFESMLMRRTHPFENTADAGMLAEALLFYKQVIVAVSVGDLANLIMVIGHENLVGLIEDKHVALTLIEDNLATRTNTYADGIIEEHDYCAFELYADQSRKRMTREEKILRAITPVIQDIRTAKRVTRKLLDTVSKIKLGKLTADHNGVPEIARSDLDNKQYVLEAVKKVLETYVQIYSKTLDLRFEVIKTNGGFFAEHNLDFKRANIEFHQIVSEKQASLTTAFILDHLLAARGEMILSSDYLSEILTTPN